MRISLNSFKPLHAATAVATLRRFSIIPLPAQPPDDLVPISDTLSLLKTTDSTSWSTNLTLGTLISSLSLPSILTVTRQLPNYQNAFQFYNYLKSTPHLSNHTPLAFQAVLEHAVRENQESLGKLYELFNLSKEQNIPLSINAGTLLLRVFGRARMLDEMVLVFGAIDEELLNTDVLNIVIDGLWNWGCVDDALKLLGEMLEPDACYPPNENTLAFAFALSLRSNWRGRSLTDEEIYCLVLGFGKYGLCPGVDVLTDIMIRFCKNGEARLASTLLQEAVEPDVVTYGTIVEQLCRSRWLDGAVKVLELMRDRELGMEPDISLHNIVIDGLCREAKQEVGFMLLQKMRSEGTCKPNTFTYNSIIHGFCKAGEIDKALQLFEQMNREGLEVDVIIVDTMMDAMCKHGWLSSAMDFFSHMRERGLKGNALTYPVLISAYCNAGKFEEAMKILDEMQGNGFRPDAIVYYSMILCLNDAGRMDDASFVLSKMEEAGFELDLVGYNIMIIGFCSRNQMDKASEMLNKMKRAGMKPDHVTYNTLLSHFCAKGEFSYAEKVIKKMVEDGLRPNVVTYEALIQGYCSSGNLEEAMGLYRDMRSSTKVIPKNAIYSMLIVSLCKNGCTEDALGLMDDMKDSLMRPDSEMYNALFKALRQRNLFETVLQYMDQMVQQACFPDRETMDLLSEWFSAVGQTELLRKFEHDFQVTVSDR